MTLYSCEAEITANRRVKYGTERMGPARKLTTVMQRSVRQFLEVLMVCNTYHPVCHAQNKIDDG